MANIYPEDMKKDAHIAINSVVYMLIGRKIPELKDKPKTNTLHDDLLKAYISILESTGRITYNIGPSKEDSFSNIRNQLRIISEIGELDENSVEEIFLEFKSGIERAFRMAQDKLNYIH